MGQGEQGHGTIVCCGGGLSSPLYSLSSLSAAPADRGQRPHHRETEMAEEEHVEKTPLEKSRDIIAQLKEMQHYSKTNIEKLSTYWLQLDDELKQKDMAKKIEGLLNHQNKFHEALEASIEAYEAVCAGMEK
jgi:hypothetical protein